ncbi:hypothetical protein [Hanstruepera marina]|uniref:hypothetical protein n=1 Tax=Hanstruepera marina TaxID=2873265 RepID=UPI001CA76444|nr:hypothetical protein [Hanstruepera marina]
MKLINRIGYYLGGFSIGLIILAFFLNGKKVSCNYGPEARVLKNINSKELVYDESVLQAFKNKQLDTSGARQVLRYGDLTINSESRKKPCGFYKIEGLISEQTVLFTIENCDSIATVKQVEFK